MANESITVVIVSPTPASDPEPEPSPREKLTSSVDGETFVKKNRRRISENPVVYKLQAVKTESLTTMGYLRKLFITFVSSTCFTFLMTLLMFIPISKILIGALFFDDCPGEPFIPIYLVVGGVVACIRDLINMLMRAVLSDQAYYDYDIPITLTAFVYTMAEFGWFVYGSIYVYRMFNNFQWKDKSAADYCSSLLYMYAFVLTTMSYFLLATTCIISGATICISQYPLNQQPKSKTVVIIHEDHLPKPPQQQQKQQLQQLQSQPEPQQQQ